VVPVFTRILSSLFYFGVSLLETFPTGLFRRWEGFFPLCHFAKPSLHRGLCCPFFDWEIDSSFFQKKLGLFKPQHHLYRKHIGLIYIFGASQPPFPFGGFFGQNVTPESTPPLNFSAFFDFKAFDGTPHTFHFSFTCHLFSPSLGSKFSISPTPPANLSKQRENSPDY
jgi:hypothetical protein